MYKKEVRQEKKTLLERFGPLLLLAMLRLYLPCGINIHPIMSLVRNPPLFFLLLSFFKNGVIDNTSSHEPDQSRHLPSLPTGHFLDTARLPPRSRSHTIPLQNFLDPKRNDNWSTPLLVVPNSHVAERPMSCSSASSSTVHNQGEHPIRYLTDSLSFMSSSTVFMDDFPSVSIDRGYQVIKAINVNYSSNIVAYNTSLYRFLGVSLLLTSSESFLKTNLSESLQ